MNYFVKIKIYRSLSSLVRYESRKLVIYGLKPKKDKTNNIDALKSKNLFSSLYMMSRTPSGTNAKKPYERLFLIDFSESCKLFFEGKNNLILLCFGLFLQTNFGTMFSKTKVTKYFV